MRLLDTNVAIYLRDQDPVVVRRISDFSIPPALSVVTVIELEGGISRNQATASTRRMLLDQMLATLPVLPFGSDEASAYGAIVAACGFSRRRIIDRMIAAQAIVAGATLITMNGPDFADIPDLELEIWSTAAQ